MKPLHVRLAAWGTVLVLAAIVSTVRAGAGDEVDHGANGPQLNGRTSQGMPIWAVLDADGRRVREIRMVWEMRCDGGREIYPVGLTARDSVSSFKTDDGGFTFAETRAIPDDDGWVRTVESRIDGGTRSGTARAEVNFTSDGKKGWSCRSGPVRWSLR